MLKINIVDGTGGKQQAMVDDEHALVVSLLGCPPLIAQKNKIFRQYLTADGTASGVSVMKVDGSATPVEFYIPAHATSDRYITAVSFVIADATPALNKFGAVAALANGCDFEYKRGSGETVTIHGTLRTNWDFVRMCMGTPSFGTGTAAFEASNIEGASEAYIPVFNFLTVMPPYGLKLDAGSEQKLIVRVNDDCTGVDRFDAIGYGFERFE